MLTLLWRSAGSFLRRRTPVEVSTATAVPPAEGPLPLPLALAFAVTGASDAVSATSLAAFASSSSDTLAGLDPTLVLLAPGFLVPQSEHAGELSGLAS